MSRTYRNKIRTGNCWGSNTEWYRSRNRMQRHKNNNELRSKVATYNVTDIEDNLQFVKWPRRDSWSEPTDGTCITSVLNIQHFYNQYINKPLLTGNYIYSIRFKHDIDFYKYMQKKYNRYLKPKQYDKNRKSRTIHMVINSLAC